MKINKVIKEDYSKIIGQIDSLKSNIAQLISVNQDSTRTVRIAATDRTAKTGKAAKDKSPMATNRLKTSCNHEKDSKKKNKSQSNKENNRQDSNETELSQKLWEKLAEVERSNQEIRSSHLILEEMLRVERERRIRLERELMAATKQRTEVGTQKDLEPNKSQSFKIFTPQKNAKAEGKRKPSKTRDEGDIESFLLVDCDDYASPKVRNIGQIEIMELIQQVSRPAPFERKEELKLRLLQAVKRFIRR